MYAQEVTDSIGEMMLSERVAMMIAAKHKRNDEMIARREMYRILTFLVKRRNR